MSITSKLRNLFNKSPQDSGAWPEDKLSPAEQLAKNAQFQNDYELAADQQATFDICKTAADEGIIEAIYLLGIMYEKGDGQKQYFEEAAACYHRAARYDKVEAQYNLALLHAQGSLGQTNYPVALEYFKAAADHGQQQAQYNLACMYDQGLGCFEDKIQALKYFTKAGDQGMLQAWNNIAVMYYEGEENAEGKGIKKDRVKAYSWTLLAAKAGVPEAIQSEPTMTQALSIDETKAGKELLDQLITKYGKFIPN